MDVAYHPRTGRSKVTGTVRGTLQAERGRATERAMRAVGDEEAARLAAAAETEVSLQNEPPPGEVEQPAAVMEVPAGNGEPIPPAEAAPVEQPAAALETPDDKSEPIAAVEAVPLEQAASKPPTKRRTKNRRRRERGQPDRRKSEIMPD